MSSPDVTASLIATHLQARLDEAGVGSYLTVPLQPRLSDLVIGCALLGIRPSELLAEVEAMRGQ